jgi:hypothetical protein
LVRSGVMRYEWLMALAVKALFFDVFGTHGNDGITA